MAQVPELPGAVTQGRNMTEAREMIQDAVGLLLESYRSRTAKIAQRARSGKLSPYTSPPHEAT